MSAITWTPTAVLSESQRFDNKVWRVVEDQHNSSTMKLVDTLDEHEILEDILENGKPPLARGTESLDFLLSSPFRYPPKKLGSRFRSNGDPGVFYAAMEFRTAAAELGYWRWKFLCSSDGLIRLDPSPQTAFKTHIRALAVDLTLPPFDKDKSVWEHPTDYSGTQQFGRLARKVDIEAIIYKSVRGPDAGKCLALLAPKGFKLAKPDSDMQTWHLTVTRNEIVWTHKF
jgi:hypothetical protein